ncbi:MAG TPA: GWxTD domain-containing protein [Gemmatimonadales bacterium]|nr:GWxTD domain-containing protein [Gemmatimonadales bacterium]
MPGFDLEQVIRRCARALVLAVAGIGCGQWQRSGTEPRPATPSTTVPALFDPTAVYRSMGYMVGGGGNSPLSFIGSVRYLAHSSADSTLAVFAMTLPNRGLSFHKSGTDYVADYHVDVVFRRGDVVERQISRDETVAVHSLKESVREDESIVFQQFIPVRPGITKVQVRVRDRNGPGIAEVEQTDTVPRLGRGAGVEGKSLGSPIPFYDGTGREQTDALPKLVLNPRATVPYGEDLLRFYFEAYGLGGGQPLVTRIVDPSGLELWRDTVMLTGVLPLASAEIAIESNQFPVGLAELVVEAPGAGLEARTPLLVSLSDEWAIANVQDLLDLLRYFSRQDLLAKLRRAAPEDRAAVWREFYKATDPVPGTATNEALDVYFQRLRSANGEFQEPGIPGWRTERGEVFITLGGPDEVFNPGSQVAVNDVRLIRWRYTNLRLTLEFRDEVGFGQYRLTPESRAEYSRVLAQVRQHE